jgi:hypothetical protein
LHREQGLESLIAVEFSWLDRRKLIFLDLFVEEFEKRPFMEMVEPSAGLIVLRFIEILGDVLSIEWRLLPGFRKGDFGAMLLLELGWFDTSAHWNVRK